MEYDALQSDRIPYNGGLKVKKSKGIYYRKDGRWEARYKRKLRDDGKVIYGSVYGASEEEVREKRAIITGNDEETHVRERRLNLLILGAGSHGRNVMEIAESLRVFNKISFVDDKATGPNILGKCKDSADLILDYPCAVIAIGDNEKRKKWAKRLKEWGYMMPNIIAPSANISPKAVLGEGVVALPNCTIGEAVVGDYCILCSNSLVSIDSKLGACSRLDEGSVCPRKSRVPEGTWLKSGEVYTKKTNEDTEEEKEIENCENKE